MVLEIRVEGRSKNHGIHVLQMRLNTLRIAVFMHRILPISRIMCVESLLQAFYKLHNF